MSSVIASGWNACAICKPGVAVERDESLESLLARHLEQDLREARLVLDDRARRDRRARSRRDRRRSPSGRGRCSRSIGASTVAVVGAPLAPTSPRRLIRRHVECRHRARRWLEAADETLSHRSTDCRFSPLAARVPLLTVRARSTYLAGRNSVNVLPLPGVLSTRISPPSSRAISRLIERPRPVPPNLRLVVPSACWNASKISCCLSFGMPMPVSLHLERDHAALARDRACGSRTAASASARWIDSVTPPCSVNLNAFDSRFLSTCCSRWPSVYDRRRHVRRDVDREARGSSARPPAGTCARRSRVTSVIDTSLGVDLHLAGFDLRQIENVVDQVEQIRARRVDRLRELDLLLRQVLVLVLREQLGEDEQRVERRAQLVAHVRQELALVLRAERQLLGLFLERDARRFDLAVLLLDLRVLLGEQRRLLLELLVDLLQLFLLLLEQLFGLPQRARLRFELGVRALELVLLLLQLLRLALQLLRQLLRLLEQLLGAHVRLNHVQHDADRLGELIEERLVDLAERQEARELDHRLHLALEQDGQDDDVARRRFAEAGRDLDVVVRNVLQQNRLLLERRLSDESFAGREAIRRRASARDTRSSR